MSQNVISLADLWSTEFPAQEFILGPRLLPRGGAMALAAETGVGKSWIALHMAQCFALGRPLFNATYKKTALFGEPIMPVTRVNKVLYIDYEITHSVRKERLPNSAFFDPKYAPNLTFATIPSKYSLDHTGRGFTHLRELVAAEKPDVLFVDPLSSAHSYPENTSEIKRAFNNLDVLRQEYGIATIVNHHASSKKLRDKNQTVVEREPIEMFRGHTSIVDWCDLAVTIYDITAKETEGSKDLLFSFAKTRHTSHRKPLKLTLDFKTGSITATQVP